MSVQLKPTLHLWTEKGTAGGAVVQLLLISRAGENGRRFHTASKRNKIAEPTSTSKYSKNSTNTQRMPTSV